MSDSENNSPEHAIKIIANMLTTFSNLRIVIAFVTISFLVMLLVYRYTAGVFQDSISAYYYQDIYESPMKNVFLGFAMRSIFIGALCSVGVLLIAYHGYTTAENWFLNGAGACLVLVVFFPMDMSSPTGLPNYFHGYVHDLSAVSFFACLFIVCVFLSQETLVAVTNENVKSLYKWCYRLIGILMLVPAISIVFVILGVISSIFWIEFGGVAVFSLYWLIKNVELHNTRFETWRSLVSILNKHNENVRKAQ
jgi:hypothetical protein